MIKKLLTNKRIQNILLLILFISFFGYFIIWGIISKRELKEGPSAYTIAVITGVNSGAKVPPWFDYKFKVQGKTYKNQYSIADKMARYPWSRLEKYIGKRFYVKFYIPDPGNNELQIYKPVPCDIKEAPIEGWKEMPQSSSFVTRMPKEHEERE